MDNELGPCAIGLLDTANKCHLLFPTHKCGLKLLAEFTSEDQELICKRSGLKLDAMAQICLHHEAFFLTKYHLTQKLCCNPFRRKGHNVKKGLRPMDLLTAEKLKAVTKMDLNPGQKLCPSCRKELKSKAAPESSSSECDQDEAMDVSAEVLNSSLTALGVSPLKFQRISKRNALGYAKRKIIEAKSVIGTQIATVGGLQLDQVIEPSTSQQCESCNDYDQLLEELKQTLKVSSRMEQLQILTLVPKSWSISQVSTDFAISIRMVKQARKLKVEKGILAVPGKKHGKVLSNDVKLRVQSFFEDDEFSRVCPGKKDCVSVRIEGQKVQMQKRLLLSNLKEMFVVYRDRNGPEIGFFKFCELRPKWCITVGSSGTHSVCVCTFHQNVKLMLAGSKIKEDYKLLLEKTVCNLASRDCMLHRCEECPGEEGLKQFLMEIFSDNDEEEMIEFKQWIHTDRDTLDSKQLSIEDFIIELAKKIWNLSSHHYIAKHQTGHLKAIKENLKQGELAILMDFAENYSFIVQDAVQGFHWENSQATLHPFVVYYMAENKIQCKSFCIISDCLRHDTISVHVYLTKLIEFLKNQFGEIANIHYFSDGSAAQYKNFKNLMNLCHHTKDFGIAAQWNFFATSHGKSPCDGIGGTAKRMAARASLQRPIDDQILTPHDLFVYCNQNLPGITFSFISKEEVEAVMPAQEKRFEFGQTVAGTRENHQFVPIDEMSLSVSRVSNDTISFMARVDQRVEGDSPTHLKVVNLQPGEYVACTYDGKWWLGNVCETSEEEHDALISFMHPNGLSSSFHWPTRKDCCWVPEEHIIATIPAPSARSLGRNYSLPSIIISCLDQQFSSKK